MIRRRGCRLHVAALAMLVVGLALPAYAGAAVDHASGAGLVRRWNGIALDASGLDHTPVAPGEDRVFGEQLGPTRANRAMAIVHIAMFDSINAVAGGFRSYTGIDPAPTASMDAAIVQPAHDTLVALFPSQTPKFDVLLADDLRHIPSGPGSAKAKGIGLGKGAAAAILSLRTNDGLEIPDPRVDVEFYPSILPGMWRQDPISRAPLALGAFWGGVRPFTLASPDQFRVPDPPALNSSKYTTAYGEVKALGGDGVVTPMTRTAEQTIIGVFWAYDGTPSLCAPPRLYNQIAVHIADQMHTSSDVVEFARLLALTSVAMADAGIAIWESKYFFQYWRPITGIRESDRSTGPTDLGDRDPHTMGDQAWSPLGAPGSNITGPNFTPPFPAYPSGHAGFGGALFQTLRNIYGTDNIVFTFTSDEFNGVTKDHNGVVRPLAPRSFSSLSEAEDENGQSRIYLGIHWHFDKTEAITQGRNVADWVMEHTFRPTDAK